ncbi:uncharacterized protein LOC112168338 isoform X2 [Rosa chinensis]|uniref:uncharacterized protein LOC112168338 isoform X2 n=1 Tax=Rosa chinensis TaxID=74649 RepID=UPI001AD91AD9|nr:uncharacterized protein LOC112168338 isoform X2 [Rosa chinensis]
MCCSEDLNLARRRNDVTDVGGVIGQLRWKRKVFKDTAIHVAVYSNNKELVASLLQKVYGDDGELRDYFSGGPGTFVKQNAFGNTPLHEAASIGNVDMVNIIMQYDRKQLNTKNKRGETPFFTAAVYGNINVIKHLAAVIKKDAMEHADDHERLYSNHTSSPGSTMLHEAIRGYYFETALELVKPEYHIRTDRKDSDGITCFQLLANIPSAFESGYSFGILEKLIYLCMSNCETIRCKSCLPVVDYSKNNDETNSVSQVPPTPNTDLERAGDHSKDKDGNKNVSHFPPSPNTAFQKITAKMYVTFWSIIAKGSHLLKICGTQRRSTAWWWSFQKFWLEETSHGRPSSMKTTKERTYFMLLWSIGGDSFWNIFSKLVMFHIRGSCGKSIKTVTAFCIKQHIRVTIPQGRGQGKPFACSQIFTGLSAASEEIGASTSHQPS